MRWEGRRESDNVEDRRGEGAGLGGFGGGSSLVPLLLQFVISKFGIGGIAVLAVGFIALNAIGVNPLALTGGPGGGVSMQRPSGEIATDAETRFLRVVLADTEDVWNGVFQNYREPTMVLFSGRVNSACGTQSAAVGPFYCPGDASLYLDTDFFAQLSRRFGAPGDFAQAYVIAHEVGHHIQRETGVLSEIQRAKQGARESDANALQVRVELQADCYAGVWAGRTERAKSVLEAGDIDEALRAAEAIGDDALQRQATGTVRPETFTHGTSAQRKRWFEKGFRTGDPAACDTLNADRL